MKAICLFILACFFISFSYAGSVRLVFPNAGIDTAGPVGTSHPIRFLSFSAVRYYDDVLLEWVIPSENTSHYQLERSENASAWTPIATFADMGSLNPTNKYQFTDRNVKSKTLYYRVRQKYADGLYSYSPIITVRVKAEDDNIKITTSFNNAVSLYFPDQIKSDIMIRLHSATGRLIAVQKITKPVGQVLIPLNALVDRSCVINISDGQHLNLSQMLIFQK